jgi:archaemetzincin
VRDREVNAENASPLQQLACAAVEPNYRLTADFVGDTDLPPRDSMTECLARRFFCREESGEALRGIAFAHGVLELFLRVDLAREPRELLFVEPVALDLRKIHADSHDHARRLRAHVEIHRSRMDTQLRIVPINAIDPTFLARLALCLEERFLYRISIEHALDIPRSAVNSSRGQMFLGTLTGRVLRQYPEDDGLLLALTDFDLYKTSHRYIFGDADEQRRIAVVSLHRLRGEFYGEEQDENALFQRTLKEAVHELGHAVGLKHCYNARCAMYYSNSIFETDNKMSHLCDICDRRSRTRS